MGMSFKTEIGLRKHVEDSHGEKHDNFDQDEVNTVIENLVHKKAGKCPFLGSRPISEIS